MGRLSGFRYRDIIKKLKRAGFEFYQQAAIRIFSKGFTSKPVRPFADESLTNMKWERNFESHPH